MRTKRLLFIASTAAILLLLIGLAFTNNWFSLTGTDPSKANLTLNPLNLSQVNAQLTRIEIHKSKYQLKLFQQNKLLKTYPVVLGPDPVNDKQREGDGATPEGTFHLRDKYAHAKWSYFLWIDYPTTESWKRFNERKAAGKIPANATIGGEIGIHGVPAGRDDLITQGQNWTLGCISLSNAHITELYSAVQVGTEVKILH